MKYTDTRQPQHLLPGQRFICFVIPSLFSKAECEQLLIPDIQHAFQKASTHYPHYYRNNDRFVSDNPELAAWLFNKVKPFLPASIETHNSIQSENGNWQLKTLNNRLRFCRYQAHQYFHRHLDGVHYHDAKTQSKLTFMIYLNDASEFKGGRTLFYESKDTETIWAAYLPKQGDLIVFDHNVWHEGEELTAGEKFVLRSDILYEKANHQDISEPFTGHLGYIWALLKINKQTLLSAGRDKEIKVWSASGELQASLKAHENSVLCLEKMDEEIFVSGSRDQHVIVWHHFKPVRRIHAHAGTVLSLCRLTTSTFASSGADHCINLIHLNGNVLKTLSGHTNWVWKVIALNTRTLASCSEDHTIKLWDIPTGTILHTFKETEAVISMIYMNNMLISGDLKGYVSIRALSKTWAQDHVTRFQAHNGIIRTIKQTGTYHFATGGEDNQVKLWSLDGRVEKHYIHQNFVQAIECLNATTLLSAAYDGTIKVTDIRA